jgi:6-pyruvoyl-tetrahydropterin synthase
LVVEVAGRVNIESGHPKEGMVLDYATIKSQVGEVVSMLDHQHLGSGYPYGKQGLGPDPHLREANFPYVPTSENILIWIASMLPVSLPWTRLELDETCTVAAILERNQEALWVPN